MAVAAVETEHVDLGLHQGLGPGQHVGAHAEGGTHPEPAQVVLRRIGIVDGLLDVLDGDEAAQGSGLVHDQQFLDAVVLEDDLGFLEGGAHGNRDQVLLGHAVPHRQIHVGLEPQVPVGQDAHELVILDHGNAGDLVLGHEGLRVPDGGVGVDHDGVRDHAGLTALHLVHFLGLAIDAEVLVDDADAALLGQGDGQASLGDGIHGGGQKGNPEGDPGREPGGQVHLVGMDFGRARDQEDVVEGQGAHQGQGQHGSLEKRSPQPAEPCNSWLHGSRPRATEPRSQVG